MCSQEHKLEEPGAFFSDGLVTVLCRTQKPQSPGKNPEQGDERPSELVHLLGILGNNQKNNTSEPDETHTCNLSYHKVEAGRSGVQSQPQLLHELKNSLGYM